MEFPTKMVVAFQKRFQLFSERCFRGPHEKVLDHSKYGFLLKTKESDRPDESGMTMLYWRRNKEDSKVVLYNLPILLLMDAHVNIQRVTSGG